MNAKLRSLAPVLLVAVSAAATAALTSACDPQQIAFASVTLSVREPANTNFREALFTNVFFAFDDDSIDLTALEGEKSFSFDPNEAGPDTHPIPLGNEAHTLHELVTIGSVAAPAAIGRVDDIELPALGDPKVTNKDGTLNPVVLEEQVLLGAPGAIADLVENNVPSARNNGAACDEKSGRGWFVGGDSGGAPAGQSYTFDEKTLLANDAFNVAFAGRVACDGDEHGQVIVWEPATDTVHFDAAGADDKRLNIDVGDSDEGPFAVVHGNTLWVGTDSGVAALKVDERSLINTAALSGAAAGHVVAVNDEVAVRFSRAGGLAFAGQVLRVVNNAVTVVDLPDGAASEILAVDVDSGLALSRVGAIVRPRLSGAAVVFETVRDGIDLHGLRPDVFVVLPALGTAVFLDTAADALLVEGASSTIGTTRETFIRTKGDALVLFGDTANHAELVVP